MIESAGEVAPRTPATGLTGPVFGLTCAMIGALALCYAGNYIFFIFPDLNDVWRSVKDKGTWSSRFVTAYGLSLWIAATAGTVWSLALAYRRPRGPSTLAINVGMMIPALALAYLVNQGAWNPMINLFLELVDPGREVPRRN